MRPGVSGRARRRDVVPETTVLVIGHDDHRVLGVGPALHRLDELDQMGAALVLAAAGVLVVLLRLDEADGGKAAGACSVLKELRFVGRCSARPAVLALSA
jgi:hypothetical protein